jgi:hypothetical protein
MNTPASYAFITTDTIVVDRPCRFHGYSVFENGGTFSAYIHDDNTASTTNFMGGTAAVTGSDSQSIIFERGIECSRGIYVTLVNCNAVIYYSLL